MSDAATEPLIHRATLTLKVQSPWITRGNLVGLFGIDMPLAKTPDGDGYILPGTAIVGRLAEVLRHFADVEAVGYRADLHSIFAHRDAANSDASTDSEWDIMQTAREGRRRLFVSDLVGSESNVPINQSGVETHVAIDPLMGRASDGALLVMEKPFATGAEISFCGEVRLIGTYREAEAILLRLRKALAWLTQIGGDRSTGGGQLVSTFLSDWNYSNIPPKLSGASYLLRLSFADLLCVADLRTSANEYHSSDVIPGGAIKGALAHQITAGSGANGALSGLPEGHPYRILGKHFSKLRIGHGFPVSKDDETRPMALPKSWAMAGGKLFDYAQLDNPSEPYLVDGTAPKFSVDWKDTDYAAVSAITKWPDVPTELRIRTQIDEERRAAQEGRLFGIVYRQTQAHDWLCTVDFDGPSETTTEMNAALQSALANGLGAVGRGGAYATITDESIPNRDEPSEGRLIMTLQTPAVLLKPQSDAVDLTLAYATAFDDLGVKASLKAIFVDERLRGAAFMAKRMRDDAPYRPWLLTEAGSVFVFDNVSASDVGVMRKWLTKGMPISPKTLAFYGLKDDADLWRYCPYLPENGYGEVRFGPLLQQPDGLNAQRIEGVIA